MTEKREMWPGGNSGYALVEAMEEKLAHEERQVWAKAFHDLGVLQEMFLQIDFAVSKMRGILEEFQKAVIAETGLTLLDAIFIEGLEEVLGENSGEESS
ncbi:MAG: hypothetical protein M3Q49_08180 [Actinomycetota bacterium]|nr:hypothetical protein [Actinomycetota bacterium]